MRTITTNNGKTLEIKWVLGPIANGQIIVDLDGDYAISEIAPDFENQTTFRVNDDAEKGKYNMYEGYTKLVSVDRKNFKGVTRLMLEKGE